MKLTIDRLNTLAKTVDFDFDKSTVFIETGTFMGETCIELQHVFDELHTIEIVPELYNSFVEIKPENVNAYWGDSGKLLGGIYKGNNKVIFWLDGHYVSGLEKIAELDVPLLQELRIINSTYKQEVLILIDDVRLFDTNINEDWQEINKNNIIDLVRDRLVQENILDDVMVIKLRGIE